MSVALHAVDVLLAMAFTSLFPKELLHKSFDVLFFYPTLSGTHGYMAPEVLSKGTAYDSSADWFSFGCMLYKLLKGYVMKTLFYFLGQVLVFDSFFGLQAQSLSAA